MSLTLLISPTTAPFPWSAATIAADTGEVDLTFDETTNGISLNLDGNEITTEDDIVLAIAKSAGLADDSTKA